MMTLYKNSKFDNISIKYLSNFVMKTIFYKIQWDNNF